MITKCIWNGLDVEKHCHQQLGLFDL